MDFLKKKRCYEVKTVTDEGNVKKLLFKAKSRSEIKRFIEVQGKVEMLEANEITPQQFKVWKNTRNYLTICI